MTPRSTLVLAAGAALALALAGCSSGGSGGAASPAPTARAAAAQGGAGAGGADRGGASGLVAEVQDGLMQVQGGDVQTAVTWTDATTFSRSVTGTTADVAVGSCVVAMLDADGAAASLRVSAATDGACPAPGRGPGVAGGDASAGGWSTGSPTDAPWGTAPTDAPAGGRPTGAPEGAAADGAPGFGGVVAGLVTAVDGGDLTVQATTADGAATTQTVTTGAATVVTTTVPADASAVAVGLCAAVRGQADDRGGMTATSVELSDAGDAGCTGRGGMSGGGFGGIPRQPGADATAPTDGGDGDA